ncbi:butyrophilin subfamily 2 member A2-like [Rhinatrema bivittatum]|uniref:butyrophilin subfamily 2 member A2-like n=1 Tax=Rhinatrema bivittatum TaxID=194408 RepID=UPI00112C8E3E|nr:butyrophilin subfamily 2 member A2-like [Rhinatrema bivittatum]
MAPQAAFAVFFLLIRVSLSKLQVTTSASPVEAKVGDEVLLTCLMTVNPPPLDLKQLMIQWFHRGKMLVEYDNELTIQDPDIQVSEEELQKGNFSLFIPNITAQRAGNYRCYIYYTSGTSMKEIVLKVEDPSKVEEKEEHDVCPKDSSPEVLKKVDDVLEKLKTLTGEMQKCLCRQ